MSSRGYSSSSTAAKRSGPRCSAPWRCSAACVTRNAGSSITCPTRPPRVKARLRRAWAIDDHALALDGLQALAGELEHSHPGAAASLREGMEETLTRLGIRGRPRRTLRSTNPIESIIEVVRRTSRNVKRWQSGEMCLRWTAAGMLEAEQQFRKIIGYSELAIAVERDLAAQRAAAHTTTTREAGTLASVCHHTGTAVTKFHYGRDNLRDWALRVQWSTERSAAAFAPGTSASCAE